MQDIIKEYGPALITVVAIIAVVAMIAAMFAGSSYNGTSFVQDKFQTLMTDFFTMAQDNGNLK